MNACAFCERDAANSCTLDHAHKCYAEGQPGTWKRGEADSYGIVIQSNKIPKFRASCRNCDEQSSDIPVSIARQWFTLDQIEWVENAKSRTYLPCCVEDCNADGTEYHHFAPRNTFGPEADNWPQLPICRAHHVEWHQRMDGYRWQRKGFYPS